MPAAGQVEKAAIRRGKALDLRIMGASYRSIAEALHVSLRTAFNDVQTLLTKQQEQNDEKADRARQLILARCDRAVFGLTPAVQLGDPQAIRTLVRVDDLRARLLGLYAPVKVAPTSPDGSQPYSPPALADAHAEFDAIIAAAMARQEPRQVGSGQTAAAAAAEGAGE